MIASLANVDLAVIVTEPTLSGIHDMERVIELTKHFKVPAKTVINKYDINLENSAAIKEICQKQNVEVLGKLPFSEIVNKSLAAGLPVVHYSRDQITEDITALWKKIE